MLVAYVSDERYVALPDVILEFEGDAGSFEARSRQRARFTSMCRQGHTRSRFKSPASGPRASESRSLPADRLITSVCSSDGLLGYAWPKWVKAGEKSEFRVHSVEPYHLSLWRYGFRKSSIRSLGWFDEHGPRATMQITPDGDYTQTGVAWNKFGYANPRTAPVCRWPPSGRACTISTPARPEAPSLPFPGSSHRQKPTAPIAVLASNITWNAYNNFGGRSNYINPDRLPPTPTVNARLELKRYTDPDAVTYDTDDYAPLSFDRPEPINHIDLATEITDPIEGRAACHIAPAEWRLLGWLEREQFAYDYYAETQLHDGTLDLDAYKVLIISTHPEYWSRTMYFAVKSWVHERGGKLMYLGGNGLNCEVEFVDPTTVIYHNGDARASKQAGYESRFHARVESEANLLGVVFSETGIMTGAPYRVLKADHWAFAGRTSRTATSSASRACTCAVRAGPRGMKPTRSRPARPTNVVRLAKGTNVDDGGAELVYYETASGGAVFSAGSIAWPSAILIDDRVSRITANVLDRFLS